jgi:hypothetical protein
MPRVKACESMLTAIGDQNPPSPGTRDGTYTEGRGKREAGSEPGLREGASAVRSAILPLEHGPLVARFRCQIRRTGG